MTAIITKDLIERLDIHLLRIYNEFDIGVNGILLEKILKEEIIKILLQRNKRRIPYSPKRLTIRDWHAWTLAHSYAKAGYIFDPEKDINILKARGPDGITVAHIQAEAGYIFDIEKHRKYWS